MFAIPILVAGLAYGWSRVRAQVPRYLAVSVQVAVSLLFLGQIGLRFAREVTTLVAPGHVTSDIPHFRGLRVPDAQHAALKNEMALLSGLAADRRLFLIGPNAGFFYLAADLRNPDAFDFPYVSVFGRAGQQDVIARIEAGEIRSVFIFSYPIDRQTPTVLQDFVRSSMVPVREEPSGIFYRDLKPARKRAAG